ncbi:MAG: MBOAT family O-acyltransferase [Pseudomonadota bacterium]
MTFTQLEFVWLFLAVFAVYWTARHRVVQNTLLVVASAAFYGWVHPWFLILLYTSATLDYSMGRCMARWPGRKKAFLALSMAGNLSILGYFKYFDFFIESFTRALTSLGLDPGLHTLGIFLPVGISFYTFQTMSYTIDVYRGELQPRKNFLDYIAFLSFFPQLVAGPVERASALLPQMERPRRFDRERFMAGLGLALWGGFKKVCIADQIAPYVDKIFIHSDPSGAMIWAATLGFTVQILADFSGYTDIARGTARMLGFELSLNFDHPYLAKNPSDFWRRWHITFSSWIRDYLYIPLGGSRGGSWATVRATAGAMLLSGLWHGAAWTFVLWGAFHALLITGYRAVGRRLPASFREGPVGRALAIPLMFTFTVFGWMIFRETHIDRLLHYWTLSPWGGTTDQWAAALVMLGVVLASSLPLLLALALERLALPRLEGTPWLLPARTTAWAALLVLILAFTRDGASDFIYFQF